MFLRTLLFSCLITFTCQGFSQFISKGKIEYERKTNQHALMDDNSAWDAAAKKSLPKFVTYYFDLSFENGRTLYKPGKDADVRQNKYWGVFDADNIISVDTDSSKIITQKSFYGDVFLVSDSIRKIEWKILPEIRKIAGFDCRKAVGKIMDSIIVVAFYTDEILTTGGPESFAGLPGMILGVAVPRMHTTWYATKVQLVNPTPADLATPKKGKKYAAGDFKKELTNILKNWGDEGKRMQWQLLL